MEHINKIHDARHDVRHGVEQQNMIKLSLNVGFCIPLEGTNWECDISFPNYHIELSTKLRNVL